MKKIKVYNKIIQLLLSISIIFATASMFTKYFVVNEKMYIDILNKTNFYSEIKDTLYKKMDDMMNSKNIKVDIKDSIITEDDIKNEAQNNISALVEYLKTGQNNIKPTDTQIYKDRVLQILKSAIGGSLNKANNELSLNENKIYLASNSKIQFETLGVKSNQYNFNIQKLESAISAEEKVRELLKQKGLTEEQAIQKAKEKGITEEQAKKILDNYGIKVDDNVGNNKNQNTSDKINKENTESSTSVNGDNPTNGTNNNPDNSTNESTNNMNSNTQDSSSSKVNVYSGNSYIDKILNGLIEEINNNIDKQFEKINFDKIFKTNKFQLLAKMTSILYRFNILFIILPIIFTLIILRINKNNYKIGLKYISVPFMTVGILMFTIFFGSYIFKAYNSFNIGINAEYFKNIFLNIMEYFMLTLTKISVAIFVTGVILFLMSKIKAKL